MLSLVATVIIVSETGIKHAMFSKAHPFLFLIHQVDLPFS